LFPEGFRSREGNDISAQMSEEQFKLLEYWQDFVKRADDMGVDTVFLLGDLIQGSHRAEGSRELLTADLDEQMEAAIKLLEPLCKGRKVAAVSGTKYHQSFDMRVHKLIAERLGGKYFGRMGNIKLKGTGVKVRILHGSSRASIYRSSVMDREILFQRAAEALKKVPSVKAIIAAHWHWYAHLELEDRHWIQVPAWMAWFPWEETGYARMQPSIGGVFLTVTSDRIEVERVIYAQVHIADKVEEI